MPDRGLLILSVAVMGLLLHALVSGIQVAVPATAAAVVVGAHSHGLGAILGQAAGSGEDFGELLRLAGAGAAAANAVNNLPAYLALEPMAETPVRLGAIVTPWGSLATLLRYDRMRAMGLRVKWGRFMLARLVAGVVTVGAAAAARVLVR